MNIVVKTEKRQGLGTNASRRLRAQGFVPAVLYGESMESTPLVLSKKDIIQIMRLETGENTIFKVAVGSEAYDAMIKDLQVDPATDELQHVDLIRISMDKPIRVAVPVVHRGEPVGVKTEGGFVDFVTREIEIECLPAAIPHEVPVDVSELKIGQHLEAREITLPEGVAYIGAADTVIASVKHARLEVVEAPAAATEAAEVAAPAQPAEPEVIARGKKEEVKES